MFVFIDLNRQWCRRIFWMFYVCVMAKRGKIHGRHQIKKKEKTQKEKRNCAVCVCVERRIMRFPVPSSRFCGIFGQISTSYRLQCICVQCILCHNAI